MIQRQTREGSFPVIDGRSCTLEIRDAAGLTDASKRLGPMLRWLWHPDRLVRPMSCGYCARARIPTLAVTHGIYGDDRLMTGHIYYRFLRGKKRGVNMAGSRRQAIWRWRIRHASGRCQSCRWRSRVQAYENLGVTALRIC